MTTWPERTVQILKQYGPMTAEKFSQLTNLPLKRSAATLGRAVMYGRIVRLSDYHPHHLPQLRMPAIYAVNSNDNRRTLTE